MPESRNEEGPVGLDWRGALLVTLGLGGLGYGLIESAKLGFDSPVVVGALVAGAAGMIGFVVAERRSAAPMMPLNLFRSSTFSGANLLTLLLYSALSGALFFFPFNLIQVQGYAPSAAGAAMLPFILIIFRALALVGRIGAPLWSQVGPVIAAAGFGLFTLPEIGGSYWTTFFPAVVVLGLGMALSVAPLTTAVMGAVDARHAALASGINNAVSRTAGLIGTAVMGVLVLSAFNSHLDTRLAALELPLGAEGILNQERIKLAAAEVPMGLSGELTSALERAIDESFVVGFRLVMLIAAGLALASGLAGAILIKGKRPAAE